jgi:hypothetical protein
MTFPRFLSFASASVSLLLALAACGGGGDDAPPPAAPPPAGLQPTLASIQANVFTPTCAVSGCHSGPAAQQGLRLEPNLSWGLLFGVMSSQDPVLIRVRPGDPDGSFLIHKLEGTQTVGARMPDGGPNLQQVTVDVIWIQNGALNN